METETIAFLITFTYLAIGFRFAKFNIGLWEAKMGNGRFNPNAHMFGTKAPTVENLLFFALFPLTSFFVVIGKVEVNKAVQYGSFADIIMERHYKKADIIGISLLFPLKLAYSAMIIAILFGVVPLAMFLVSIIYPALTIFTEKPAAEEKQEEA